MPATYEVEINGKKLRVEVKEAGLNTYRVRVGGSEFIVKISSRGISVSSATTQQSITVPQGRQVTASSAAEIPATPSAAKEVQKPLGVRGKEVKAEVPGKVLKVLVGVGQDVKAEDTIITIESMKMELEVKAGVSGKVIKLMVKPGDSVNTGDIIAIIQPEA